MEERERGRDVGGCFDRETEERKKVLKEGVLRGVEMKKGTTTADWEGADEETRRPRNRKQMKSIDAEDKNDAEWDLGLA